MVEKKRSKKQHICKAINGPGLGPNPLRTRSVFSDPRGDSSSVYSYRILIRIVYNINGLDMDSHVPTRFGPGSDYYI